MIKNLTKILTEHNVPVTGVDGAYPYVLLTLATSVHVTWPGYQDEERSLSLIRVDKTSNWEVLEDGFDDPSLLQERLQISSVVYSFDIFKRSVSADEISVEEFRNELAESLGETSDDIALGAIDPRTGQLVDPAMFNGFEEPIIVDVNFSIPGKHCTIQGIAYSRRGYSHSELNIVDVKHFFEPSWREQHLATALTQERVQVAIGAAHITSLTALNNELHADNTELRSSVDALQRDNAQLQGANAMLENEKGELQRENTALKGEVSALKGQLDMVTQSNRVLTARLSEVSARLAQTNGQLHKAQQLIDRLTNRSVDILLTLRSICEHEGLDDILTVTGSGIASWEDTPTESQLRVLTREIDSRIPTLYTAHMLATQKERGRTSLSDVAISLAAGWYLAGRESKYVLVNKEKL